MTINPLGELDCNPGSQRRLSAYLKREFVASSKKELTLIEDSAWRHAHNRNVYNNWAYMASKVGSQMKKSRYEYRCDSEDEGNRARELFEKAAKLQKDIRKNKWEARWDSTVGFCQTLKGKLTPGVYAQFPERKPKFLF